MRITHGTKLNLRNPGFKHLLSVVLILALALACLNLSSCSEKEPVPEANSQAAQRVLVSGSASVIPLLKSMAAEFSKSHPEIEIVFPPSSHSDAGLAGTAEEEYDIGAISREILPGEKEGGLRYLHLAIDGMVFATNPDVKISNLSTDQIRHIYDGKIANWKEVGGPDAKITVIDRSDHTSAKIAFRGTFLGSDFIVTPEAVTLERPWQVTDSIQLMPHSIGYTSLGEIISEAPPVNIISINGVAPTPENLKNGRYKFFRPFGLILGPNPKAATMRFVEFVFSDTGSRIIKILGYRPQRYEILIGIVPEQNVMVQDQRYRPLADYLSYSLNERFSVKIKLFPTYIEACRALVDGDINAAFLGSLAYTAVREYVDVLARPDYGGVSTYKGLIFARTDSGIETLEQMRGKRIILGGRTTTAGYVFPIYYFTKHGIPDYERYFSETNFAGTHEDAILAVLNNQADIGAAKDLILHSLSEGNPALESEIRILAESPPVPSNAFVLRKDVSFPCFECHQKRLRGGGSGENASPQNMGMVIKERLLGLSGDPEGKKALAAVGNASGFLETTAEDYSELYSMLENIGLNPEDLLKRERTESDDQ